MREILRRLLIVLAVLIALGVIFMTSCPKPQTTNEAAPRTDTPDKSKTPEDPSKTSIPGAGG